MENLGFLYAMGAALAWGTFLVPFKKSNSTNLLLFQLIMGIGILISGLVIATVVSYPLNVNVYGLATGFLWATANAISLVGVANLGLSRGVPILVSMVILSSFIWGALIFGEHFINLAQAILAIGFIVGGVFLVGSTSSSSSINFKKGLIAALAAGTIFGSQFVPVKLFNVSPENYFFSMSIGIFLTSWLVFAVGRGKFEKRAIIASLLSGTVWNIGNLFGVTAIAIIGLAKGLPITQSSVLVAVLWGIIYFREVRSKKLIIRVIFGALILLGGVFGLASA